MNTLEAEAFLAQDPEKNFEEGGDSAKQESEGINSWASLNFIKEIGGLGMCRIASIRKSLILLAVMLLITMPFYTEAGHGGGGMGMGGMGGGCCGGSYGYGYGYSPVNTAAWRAGSILGYPGYGYGYGYPAVLSGGLYSPYYGLGGLGYGGLGYSGLGYGYPYVGLGAGLGLSGLGYLGGSVVTGRDLGIEQSYTTFVPGGAVTTTVTNTANTANPYFFSNPYAYGLGYGGYYPYAYGLGSAII